MLFIIGANSALTLNMIQFLDSYDIVLAGRTRPDILANFPNTTFVETDYKSVKFMKDISLNFSNLTVFFAGVEVTPNLITDIDLDKARIELDSNLFFYMEIIQQLLPGMIKFGGGRIIFSGSKISSLGVVGGCLYEIIKSAQKGLSRTLAVEYGRFGITSNVIEIGLLGEGYSNNLTNKRIENLKSRIPTQDSIEYEEIANIVKLLIGNPSINGSILTVDQALN